MGVNAEKAKYVQQQLQSAGMNRREARRAVFGNDRKSSHGETRGQWQNRHIAANARLRRYRRVQSVHSAIATAEAAF